MVAITPTKIQHPFMAEILIWKWASVTESDAPEAVVMPRWADLSIMTVGTIGSPATSVALTGTLNPADTGTFPSLRDTQGTVIAHILADSIDTVQENVYKVKPVLTGGTGASVDIYVMGK